MDATVEPPAEAKSNELEMAVDVYRHLDELEDQHKDHHNKYHYQKKSHHQNKFQKIMKNCSKSIIKTTT
jgi:hypothetical protein